MGPRYSLQCQPYHSASVVRAKPVCCGSCGDFGRPREIWPCWSQTRWPSLGSWLKSLAQVSCLPQREFLGQGSLRDQLTGGEGGKVREDDVSLTSVAREAMMRRYPSSQSWIWWDWVACWRDTGWEARQSRSGHVPTSQSPTRPGPKYSAQGRDRGCCGPGCYIRGLAWHSLMRQPGDDTYERTPGNISNTSPS